MKERTIQILTRFLSAETYVTYEELAKEFHVSVRTMRNEIDAINRFLLDEGYKRIDSKRQKGMKLRLPAEKQQQLLDALGIEQESSYYTPEERFLLLLLEIVDKTNVTYLYQMEEVLQVSKSTVDDDMRKLRHFIDRYGLEVTSSLKQGVILTGDERSIRTMLFDILNNMANMDDLLLTEIPGYRSVIAKAVFHYLSEERLTKIAELYDETWENSSVTINQVYRTQIILFTAVWLRRLEEGARLNEAAKIKLAMKEDLTRIYTDKLCQTFALVPSLNELKYLMFIIDSFNPKDMSNSFDWVTAQLLTIQLIEHVERETGIPFSTEEEELYEGVYKHMTGLLNRMKNEVQIFNPLKETIQEVAGAIYQAIATFGKRIEAYTKKQLSEDEISFLTIYFSTTESQMRQESHLLYRAVVVCNHGVSTGKLLAAHLEEQFDIEIAAVLSSRELPVIDSLDVDLVFTTIPLDYDRRPTLLLHPILKKADRKEVLNFLEKHSEKRRHVRNELDATKLLQDVLTVIGVSGGTVTQETYQKVAKTFEKHRLKINVREIQPMLQDILKESDILLQKTCGTWQEAVTCAAQPLLERGVVEARYIQSMIQSVEEFGPYIVLGKHFALAHARPEDGVNELGISVMTLKTPVVFGHEENDPVKIIFCLAAVDAYSHLSIMKTLIGLINDQTKLDQLIASQATHEFIETLCESQ